MAFNKENKTDAPFRKRSGFHRKKKVCVFCGKDSAIDYKDAGKLRKYISESGNQRALTVAIKRARHVAILPYAEK